MADGVILLSGASVRALDRSLGFVQAGALEVGRRDVPFDVVVSAFTHVTDDVERDARNLKPIIAAIAQTGGTGLFKHYVGEQRQEMLGFNASGGVNLRVTFILRKATR